MDNTRSKSIGASSETALLSRVRKRRLATTRGLTKQSITPTNSPSRVSPCNSTPAAQKPLPFPLLGASAIPRGNQLPPHPPYSPVGQSSFLLPEAVRVSVISPTLQSSPFAEKDPSLDWDDFHQTPSYSNIVPNNNTQVNDCITGIQKITLVDTSVTSLSSCGKMTVTETNEPKALSPEEKANLDLEIQQDNIKLNELHVLVNDMMEDYTDADVRKGNVELVQKRLDIISDARSKFRTFVRKYKQKYGNHYVPNCEIAEKSLNDINISIREHADKIWSKVEAIQEQQQVQQQTESNHGGTRPVVQPVYQTGNANSVSQGDLIYRKNLYRDQLLYLRDSLSLPQSGTISDHWLEKSDSDICQAMKDLGRWQTSLEKLSSTFREYEKLCTAAGTSEDFESDSEDFETVRNQVKEVIIAVKAEDSRRNLQTLLPQKSAKIKYPVFSGDIGEDFVKFRAKMEDCFKKNRIL